MAKDHREDFFREATLRVCGDLDIEKAMTEFRSYLREFMPADRLILERYDDAPGVIRSVVVAGPEGARRSDDPTPLSKEAKDYILRLFRNGIPDPYFDNDPVGDPTTRELLESNGLKASAIINLPLGSIGNEPAGLVVVAEEGGFTDADLNRLALLRSPLQMVLANTRHHAEVERLNDALAIENRRLYRQHAKVYLGLRKAVGMIGILLPFTLMLGHYLVFRGNLALRSISRYYHTGMRNVFVAALCSVALFMFFYSGYGRRERWAGIIGGFLALGVVFFPTTLSGPADWIGTAHYASAFLLFTLLSWMSLFHFPRKRPGMGKQVTDYIQFACGLIMAASIVSILAYFLFFKTDGKETCFIFIAETVALVAFGVSWLTEGLEMERELAVHAAYDPNASSPMNISA